MPINSTTFKAYASEPGIVFYSGIFNATTLAMVAGGQGCRVTEPTAGTYTIQLPGVGTRNILYSSVRFLNNSLVAAPSVDPFWSVRNDATSGQVTAWYTFPIVMSSGYKYYKREADTDALLSVQPEITLWQAPGGQTSTMGVVRLHPGANLTADNANYASLIFRRRSSTGALISTVTVTTQAAGAGSTGSWTAFDDLVLPGFVPLITYNAGDTETLEITKTGAGVILPQLMIERTPAAFNPVDLSSNQLVSFYIAVKNSSA